MEMIFQGLTFFQVLMLPVVGISLIVFYFLVKKEKGANNFCSNSKKPEYQNQHCENCEAYKNALNCWEVSNDTEGTLPCCAVHDREYHCDGCDIYTSYLTWRGFNLPC